MRFFPNCEHTHTHTLRFRGACERPFEWQMAFGCKVLTNNHNTTLGHRQQTVQTKRCFICDKAKRFESLLLKLCVPTTSQYPNDERWKIGTEREREKGTLVLMSCITRFPNFMSVHCNRTAPNRNWNYTKLFWPDRRLPIKLRKCSGCCIEEWTYRMLRRIWNSMQMCRQTNRRRRLTLWNFVVKWRITGGRSRCSAQQRRTNAEAHSASYTKIE